MATTEIGSEFLTTIRISFSQMIEIADKLNKEKMEVHLKSENLILEQIIYDAKSILSQMEGFV